MAVREEERALDHTPTWAVAAVCASIVLVSIVLEKIIHKFEKMFERKKKMALLEALAKIKGELMVLGFISLILTFGQTYISKWCIPEKYANTMLPCVRSTKEEGEGGGGGHNQATPAGAGVVEEKGGAKEGMEPLISVHGMHQLHIFIFFLAVFHVVYSAITMTLGRAKIRGWKAWEQDHIVDQEALNGKTTMIPYSSVCFFRQFFRSVRKADYLTMRHGFVTRSLEDDFKVVVGISPILWASVVFFLLVNVHGWHASFGVSFLPLMVILAVGTKLQAIITRMALDIKERHAVVQGIPLVQVSDKYFWFEWPELVLYLIHFVLFQNAFELTYFWWTWYEFGWASCFYEDEILMISRVALGIGAQIITSYVTLPLYALVTQMGSTMKKSIFDEQTSKALKKWHQNALKKIASRGRHATLGGTTMSKSPDGSPSKMSTRSPNAGQSATILSSVDNTIPAYDNRDLLTGP
ncbi:MLO-like protein [Arachis hypogaea]|nr:MLO-like protein [Arachis hypogaea]